LLALSPSFSSKQKNVYVVIDLVFLHFFSFSLTSHNVILRDCHIWLRQIRNDLFSLSLLNGSIRSPYLETLYSMYTCPRMFLSGKYHAMTKKWLSYLNVPRFNRSRTGLIRYPYVYFLTGIIKIALRKRTFLLRKSLAGQDRRLLPDSLMNFSIFLICLDFSALYQDKTQRKDLSIKFDELWKIYQIRMFHYLCIRHQD